MDYAEMNFADYCRHFAIGQRQIDRVELDEYRTEAEINGLAVSVLDYDQPKDDSRVNVLVYRQMDSVTEDRVYGSR